MPLLSCQGLHGMYNDKQLQAVLDLDFFLHSYESI